MHYILDDCFPGDARLPGCLKLDLVPEGLQNDLNPSVLLIQILVENFEDFISEM